MFEAMILILATWLFLQSWIRVGSARGGAGRDIFRVIFSRRVSHRDAAEFAYSVGGVCRVQQDTK